MKAEPVAGATVTRVTEPAGRGGGRDWRSRVAELAPLIEQEAPRGEELGTLSPVVVDAFDKTGLYSIFVPAEAGGEGCDLLTFFEVQEEITRLDPATGWSYMAGSAMAAIVGAYVRDDDAVAEIFLTKGVKAFAGMLAPLGKAVAEGDGFRVAGRFSFGSGIRHATWISGGAIIHAEDGPVIRPDGQREQIAVVVPASNVELLGNWDVYGLQATGSDDFALPEQVVPYGFTFSMSDVNARRGRGLFRMGHRPIAAASHCAIAFGITRRALEEVVEVAARKARPGLQRVADQQMFMHDFSYHDAAVRSARAYTIEVFGDAQESVEAGGVLSDLQYHRLRQACTYAHAVGTEAVSFAYHWAGATALRSPHPLGRCLREMAAATQHIYVDPNTLVDAAPSLMESASEYR